MARPKKPAVSQPPATPPVPSAQSVYRGKALRRFAISYNHAVLSYAPGQEITADLALHDFMTAARAPIAWEPQ